MLFNVILTTVGAAFVMKTVEITLTGRYEADLLRVYRLDQVLIFLAKVECYLHRKTN